MESKVHTMAVVAAMAAIGGEYSHSLPRRDRSKTILTKKQKKALLGELQSDIDLMVVSIDSAVIGGELPAKALSNAERIQNNVNKANPKLGTDGITAKSLKRINLSAERIERYCVAAGNDLPIDNINARSL